MFKEKKHVGRPSNEELKIRRNKKLLLIGGPIVLIVLVVALIATGNISNLMGNSVTEYYCEDSSYTLEGNKCVKEIKEKSVLLGDVNLDDKITNKDLDLITRYIKYIDFDESDEEVSNLMPIQIKAADVSEDNEVYNQDKDILKAYLENNSSSLGTYQENIGVKRICNDGFDLEGAECLKKEFVEAKVKENINSQNNTNKKDEEAIGANNNNNNNQQISSQQNPVEVVFKPQDNKTTVPYNTKYILNVDFKVNDTSKPYYYLWSAYLNGKKNNETKCTKITPGEHYGSLIITGKRIVSLTVYTDSQCKNKIKTVNSKEYVCSDCDKSVDVTLRPQDNNTLLKYGTKYKMDVIFDINDTSKQYYYIWYNFKNGVNNYKTNCTKVTQGAHGGSFVIDGTKKVQVLIYADSSCKKVIKTVGSKTYTTSKTFRVNYDANGGSGKMNSQNITYNVSTSLNPNAFVRNNYYFIGWRVYNNSNNKCMCYTNKNKTSMGYTDVNTCKTNGYVVYRDKTKIATTASIGQTITMKALWQYSYANDKTSFAGFKKDPKGATVWTMVRQNLYQNSNGTKAIAIIPQGVALKVIDMTNKTNENKSYVKVQYGGKTGYIDGWITMINLPDVVTNALYNITNASSSLFISRGHSLYGVTGYDIYGSSWTSNIAPIRIETAKKIQKAANLAERKGNRIKIYDSFRPWTVQRKIADAVNANWFTGKAYNITSDFNKDKNRNTNGAGVTSIADAKGWFIAIAKSNPSSHNLAKAIDVTLVTIEDNQDVPTQSKMHELSGNSIPTKSGVDNNKAELSLHNLFMDAGFYFLPSEWWHFEDQNNANYGKYYNELKCLGSPFKTTSCGVNQIKKA